MDRRIITLLGVAAVFAAVIIVFFRSSKDSTSEPTHAEQTVTTLENTSVPQEEMIEVVVDDATGEILGIKANEVGDYYIINPQNEVMISKEGHSTKFIPAL